MTAATAGRLAEIHDADLSPNDGKRRLLDQNNKPKLLAVPSRGWTTCQGGAVTVANPGKQPRVADRLHDVDTAADYLRCGRRLIYRLVAERKIKFTKAGRSLRFWQSDLDAYLDARAVEPITGSSLRR